MKINRNTTLLIGLMALISTIGVFIAWKHYSGINRAEDPRVVKAKTIYLRYDQLAQEKKYTDIILLLDSMTSIYSEFSDYKESYEVGVIYNNKAAVYVSNALFETDDGPVKDSLFSMAKENVDQAIYIYNNWMEKYGKLNENELMAQFSPIYEGSSFTEENKEKFLEKRVSDLIMAQKENPRRLSVSYTNLGIIYRHQGEVELSVENYKKALDLWDQNLSAENNINILLGKPVRKRSMLDKLFPEKK